VCKVSNQIRIKILIFYLAYWSLPASFLSNLSPLPPPT
jgi:hypothetical protein